MGFESKFSVSFGPTDQDLNFGFGLGPSWTKKILILRQRTVNQLCEHITKCLLCVCLILKLCYSTFVLFFLFSLVQVQIQSLNQRFGPKLNTKITFNTHPPYCHRALHHIATVRSTENSWSCFTGADKLKHKVPSLQIFSRHINSGTSLSFNHVR